MTSRATITREELRRKIERGDSFHLFEVLPEPYYRKHHLPGAVHMPPTDVEGTAKRLAPDKGAEIIVLLGRSLTHQSARCPCSGGAGVHERARVRRGQEGLA